MAVADSGKRRILESCIISIVLMLNRGPIINGTKHLVTAHWGGSGAAGGHEDGGARRDGEERYGRATRIDHYVCGAARCRGLPAEARSGVDLREW